MENKYKKLMGNSIVFAVGNLGSKIITFLLVPMYTYLLTESQYGTADLITTLITMLLPVVSLSVNEGVLRYTVDDKTNKSFLIEGFKVCVCGNFIFILIAYIVHMYIDFLFLPIICAILFSQSIQSILAQYLRGTGKIKEYALNGIFMSLVLVISNVLFLAVFKMGIEGYLFSIFLSTLFSIIYMVWISNIKLQDFKLENLKIQKNALVKLIGFSMPLIPNSLMWWLMNASSRFFIVYFISTSANGIFAVSTKIPSILSIFYSIFFQAWQLSAIEEYQSENVSQYYSQIFDYLSKFMVILSSSIIICIRPVIRILISQSFFSAWMYIPMLLLATVFSSLSGFVGTTFTVSMKTKGVFISSVFGAMISVILNLLLIPLMGIMGAVFSQVFSFATMWIMRHYQTKSMVRIVIEKKVILILILLFIQAVIPFFLYDINIYIYYICEIILWVFIVVVCWRDLKKIINLILKLK